MDIWKLCGEMKDAEWRHRPAAKPNRWVYPQRDGYCRGAHLHQIWVLRVSPPTPSPPLATLPIHRKAGVCLIIWSKISELKVEARGREGQGHPGAGEVVRHDLLKSGAAKPQGHPLVLWPIGAGRPTINLLCTLNPFNTHHDPDEEISSLREGHITLLALCIHWQLLYSNSVLWVTSYCKYFNKKSQRTRWIFFLGKKKEKREKQIHVSVRCNLTS